MSKRKQSQEFKQSSVGSITGISALRLGWVWWIGIRYLRSKKNSKFLSFITWLSIGGVALGVTALIVVLSVMDGFEGELKKRLMSTDLHILVSPTERTTGFERGLVSSNVLDERSVLGLAEKSKIGIESISPVLSTEVMMKSGKKVAGVILKGVNQSRISMLKKQLTEVADARFLIERKEHEVLQLSPVYVGQELAFDMGLIPGDQMTLISPTEMDGPLGNIPRMKRFVIAGVYHSGLPEQEMHTLFTDQGQVESFLRKSGVVNSWEIALTKFDDAPKLAALLNSQWPDLKSQDWMELNAHLFASLKLERICMFVILAFIVVVASFNIVTTLTLMVLEKKKEISILKAMGARDEQVAGVFLAEGLWIGAGGVSIGAFFGLLLCGILKRYEFIQLPDVYYDRNLPVTFNLDFYAYVCSIAFLIVVAACLYPSRRAAQMPPIEGIRQG